MELDPRTLVVSASMSAALMAVVFHFQSRSFPPTIRGVRDWGWACTIIFVAALLIALRGTLSPLLSIVLANVLLLAGIMAFYTGLRQFHDRLVPRTPLAFGLLAATFALIYFTYGHDSFTARTAVITFSDAVVLTACAVTVWKDRVHRTLHFSSIFTLVFLLGEIGISVARGVYAVTLEPELNDIMQLARMQATYLAAYAITVFGLAVGLILMAHDRLKDELEYLVTHDSLTGVVNRRAFQDRAESELSRSRRSLHELSLLVIDLDNFKLFNDSYGHLAGDRALQKFSAVAQVCLRREDVLGRLGGEEFLVLLPETGLDAACAVAERIRSTVAAARFSEGEYLDLRITISVGVACASENIGYEDLVRLADNAVYKAKASGRNRVQVA